MSKPRILMIGPGRNEMGGIATVAKNYFDYGLCNLVDLHYISTMYEGCKAKKLVVAALAYLQFCFSVSRCDIVHVHMAAHASFDRKALFIERAFRAGKKIIIHQHSPDFDDYFLRQVSDRKRLRIRKIFSMADCVIVLSDEWVPFFSQHVCDAGKIVVIQNGVPATDFVRTDYSSHSILTLGKLGNRKGTYDLLNAVPAVLKVFPDAVFYLGGNGDIEQCRELAVKLGIDSNVFFLGWVNDPEKEKYLKLCSVFVLPSYHEGLPMAILEAMSFSLPVVSTNVGGIPSLVCDGVNGYLITPGNCDDIASSVISLLSDSSLRESMGRRGFQLFFDNFSIESHITRIFELYIKLL